MHTLHQRHQHQYTTLTYTTKSAIHLHQHHQYTSPQLPTYNNITSSYFFTIHHSPPTSPAQPYISCNVTSTTIHLHKRHPHNHTSPPTSHTQPYISTNVTSITIHLHHCHQHHYSRSPRNSVADHLLVHQIINTNYLSNYLQ